MLRSPQRGRPRSRWGAEKKIAEGTGATKKIHAQSVIIPRAACCGCQKCGSARSLPLLFLATAMNVAFLFELFCSISFDLWLAVCKPAKQLRFAGCDLQVSTANCMLPEKKMLLWLRSQPGKAAGLFFDHPRPGSLKQRLGDK